MTNPWYSAVNSKMRNLITIPSSKRPVSGTAAAGRGVSLRIYAKLVLVAFLWGGTFVAGRTMAQEVPFMTAATLRFMIAAPLLLAVAWKLEGGLPRLSGSQLVATFVLGFTGIFVYNVCFFAALSLMPAGRTALFVALNPIVTVLLLATLLRERIGMTKWTGIALAFAGAAIVITKGELLAAWRDMTQQIGAGEAFMICAVSSWAAYTIVGRVALKGLTPIATTTYAVLWGLVLLAAGAALEFRTLDTSKFTWQVWSAIAYLGVFGTVVGFIWYYEGVKAIGPSRTAVFNNLVPVFGIVLASLLLSEPILFSMVVGGTLVIGGVTLTNRQ